jgi:pimeloyl-ACP methyl ester carboxylesterase
VATFLVAHGAWSAGWAWKKVRPLLRERGHEVFTPTYTGLGERAHLASRDVGLETHVADVLAVLEYEDLHQVVLVGHSYGGMVATLVADRAPGRLAQVVYLDAFVPRDGQCLLDLLPADFRTHMREAARAHGDGWRIPPNPPPADTGPEDLAWILPRRVLQPVRCFEEPAKVTGAGAGLPRTFVYCTRLAPGDVFGPFARRARTEPGWRCLEIDASHSPNVTAPAALADLLDGLARAPAG